MLDNTNNRIKLVLQLGGAGHGGEFTSWRYDFENPTAYTDIDHFVRLAQIAEKGKIHALFFADTPVLSNDLSYRSPMYSLEPMIILSAIAQATTHIGLGATLSTSHQYPYNIARQLKALDVISKGRVAWNAVTTSCEAAAQNFGEHVASRQERYARANEVLEAVQRLWGSWGEKAWIHNKKTGVYADMNAIRPIHFKGKYIATKGPLPIPPSPQGQPVIFQAGSSPEGIALAGRFANGVYANPFSKEESIAYRQILKQSAVDFHRQAKDIGLYAGLMFTIGDSVEEALEKRRELLRNEPQQLEQLIHYLSAMIQIDLSRHNIHQPLAPSVMAQANAHPLDPRSPRAVALIKAGWSPFDVLAHGVINYHPVIAGTAEQVADFMQDWFCAGAVDGFNLAPSSSQEVHHFVEKVVPILQARGLYHQDYQQTLRENLDVSYQYGYV